MLFSNLYVAEEVPEAPVAGLRPKGHFTGERHDRVEEVRPGGPGEEERRRPVAPAAKGELVNR